MRLPEEFIERMNVFFENSSVSGEGFLESFDKEPLKGLRMNRTKTPSSCFNDVLSAIGEAYNEVKWCDGGFYVENDSLGKDPYYHAGVFYPQEPSAMLPAQVLSVKEGDNVLDLCAAPGGKACRLGEDLNGTGLLVANEINEERAKALLRNIERMGIANAVILNETPEHLAERFEGFFDKILVDAPCSGEGMFRRDPFAVKSWEKFGPEVCIKLQADILKSAHMMLKPGGELVYSTCTFCEGEDEQQIISFMKEHPEYKVISHPEISGVTHLTSKDGLEGAMRIWPHVSSGDGHFCVHLIKEITEENKDFGRYDFTFAFRKRTDNYSFNKSKEALGNFMKEILKDEPYKVFAKRIDSDFVIHKDKIHLLQVNEHLFDKLKVVKLGSFPGEIKETNKGRLFVPSHSLCLSLKFDDIREDSRVVLTRDDPRLQRYLKGETVSLNDDEKDIVKKKGTIVVCVDKYPLGFGKTGGDFMIKNLYPKTWRLL